MLLLPRHSDADIGGGSARYLAEAEHALSSPLVGTLVYVKPNENSHFSEWQWGLVSRVEGTDRIFFNLPNGKEVMIARGLVVAQRRAVTFAMEILAGYEGNCVHRFAAYCPLPLVCLT